MNDNPGYGGRHGLEQLIEFVRDDGDGGSGTTPCGGVEEADIADDAVPHGECRGTEQWTEG